MNRPLVLRAAGVAALLGAVVGIANGWGVMQPMGVVAGGIVGYSVSRVSDAIFDGLLAGFVGGTWESAVDDLTDEFGEDRAKQVASATKDELLRTERWRNRF